MNLKFSWLELLWKLRNAINATVRIEKHWFYNSKNCKELWKNLELLNRKNTTRKLRLQPNIWDCNRIRNHFPAQFQIKFESLLQKQLKAGVQTTFSFNIIENIKTEAGSIVLKCLQ